MQSRMDKYEATTSKQYRSRTQKNQKLYDDVKKSAITSFDVNSNVSVIGTSSDNIDVNKLSRMLDKKYNNYSPKRKSIDIPDEISYEEEKNNIVDTKEYDINAILAKAKQGKNVDYNKERLKKVRDAQYEILNNLDLELKKVEEPNKNYKKSEEENLMNLINTITQLELKNKEDNKATDVDVSLSILSDLTDENEKVNKEENEEPEEIEEIEEDEDDKTRDEHIEDTLSKLDIDMSSYDDFADISKKDPGAIIIKIIIFLIIIALVVGAVYILDIILNLGLF